MKKNDESAKIAYFISDFLNTYAPTFLTNSRHTLKSYKDSLVLYLSFLETENIKPDCFSRECFERAWLEKWILWLKETRQCSADTCNVRLGSLRVFLEYLGEKDIEYLYLYQEAKKNQTAKMHQKESMWAYTECCCGNALRAGSLNKDRETGRCISDCALCHCRTS